MMKAAPIALVAGALATTTTVAQAQDNVCSKSAHRMYLSCRADLEDELFEARTRCLNIADPDDGQACREESMDDYFENWDLCRDQLVARRELCAEVGEAPYDMSDFWVQDNFVDPDDIGSAVTPNPWLDLSVGRSSTFYGAEETIAVEVTGETKLIEGVRCRTVTDLVTDDGKTVEDTGDWYARDLEGNVWYCGEIAINYEFYEGDDPEEAEVVDIDGSWKAFRDGAQPGILLHASPEPGTTYRQEVAWGEAEDVASVLTVSADGLLEGDECEDEETTRAVADYLDTMCDGDCLVTLEYSPIEPGVSAQKYYAPGEVILAEVEDGACVATEGVIAAGSDGNGNEDDEEEVDS